MIDFTAAVVERSRSVPVVVDFWAPWCGPCRILGPIIEQLAEQAEGRWELVKINTEEQPELAEAYGVMSIPAVKMFHHGRVAAEFLGALPAEQIRQWLDSNLPDQRLDRLAAIVSGWESLGGAGIETELEAFVTEHPDLPAGRIRLALALVGRDPGRARDLIASTPRDDDLAELAADVTSLADLMSPGDDVPPKLEKQFGPARAAFAAHDLDGALEHLVDAAMTDKRFGDELARRVAVALFRLLGHDHELTRKHQRRLAMALHS